MSTWGYLLSNPNYTQLALSLRNMSQMVKNIKQYGKTRRSSTHYGSAALFILDNTSDRSGNFLHDGSRDKTKFFGQALYIYTAQL